ncbi:MAG: 50S ribosome-binding GTPase [Phycisphaeraceae bacterium]|nr:MAG: 50S ribosome-binding GTPase [Phycisphaeraceae bacterium]
MTTADRHTPPRHPALPPRAFLATPPNAAGALAVVQLAAEPDGGLAALGIAPIPVGGFALRDLLGVDRGLIARPAEHTLLLMPHAGKAVVRSLLDRLGALGFTLAPPEHPRLRYPEARSVIEALALDALARAHSPAAIDLLLAQPARWAGAGLDPDRPDLASSPTPRDRRLRRLIDPPLIVALGPPNVGKSTLLNTLAGRSVALVADQPGTTRDHIGVSIDLSGLVVRYADTPGLRPDPDPIEEAAARIALDLARDADLLLLLGDAAHPPPTLPDSLGSSRDVLCVALRADLGRPAWPHDLAVSCYAGADLDALAARLRDHLLPPADVHDPAPWRFWD